MPVTVTHVAILAGVREAKDEQAMKVATWNVNSLRKRLPALLDWLEEHEPDVLCLQETKVRDEDFPGLAFAGTGYHVSYRGKSGFNGVATLTRTVPERVWLGFGESGEDEDDRLLVTLTAELTIVNSYVPQGQRVGSDKYAYKLRWLARMREYFEERLDAKNPVIWMGDLNVAPEPIDVYHPEKRMMDPDFHIDARNAWKHVVEWGFIDLFRMLYPGRVQYTYWDYFRNAYANNWGWRIDHILATGGLAGRCRRVEVDESPRRAEGCSDHTVVWAEFD